MRPNDSFSYLGGQPIQPDLTSLASYYLPIMGSQALALYSSLVAFDDRGAKMHTFSHLLNHLNMGMADLEKALKALIALHLIKFYQNQDNFILAVQPPLSQSAFFKHQVLTKLLERKIGEEAVRKLQSRLPEMAKPVEASLMAVFGADHDLKAPQMEKEVKGDFDLAQFKQLMGRDGLRFTDEKEQTLALIQLAESHRKTWFDLYQLAKTSAVSGELSIKRLANQLKQADQPTGTFSQAEKQLINWANARQPLAFLTDIKEQRKAQVLDYERQLIKQIARLGLLDAVINTIVLYSLNQTSSANLNEKFVLKVANDFAYQEINSVEKAVIALRTWGEKKPSSTKSKGSTERTSNVPDWSKEDYRTEATPEEKAELEELRRQMLGGKET